MDTEKEPEETATGPADNAPSEPSGLQIDLSKDDDDDNLPAVAESPEATKKGRRRQFRELRESLTSERGKREALELKLAEFEGRLSATAQQQTRPEPRETGPNPYDSAIDTLWEQQEGILQQIANPQISEAKADELKKKWRALESKRHDLHYEKRRAAEGPPAAGLSEDQILQSEFGDIYANPIRLQEAKTELLRLVYEKKKPANLATAREAARLVQERYTRKVSPPSESDRARHTSVPGRAGVNGGGGKSFTPTKLHINTARGYTEHLEGLSDEQRVRIWLKGPGKKLKLG